MSSKSRYILAAQQLAYHNELKKSLDANTGAYIKRISLADYMRMLINEGVLTEPPPAVNWAEVAAASQESGVPFNVQKSAMADWAREALTLIKKDYGVTGGSNTPGYDTKRGIFIDNGGGYAGDASSYTWGVQVSGRDGEASTNQGGGLFSGLSRGSGLQEDGSYDSPWGWDLGLQALSQSNNSIGLAEQRLQEYSALKARSDNLWGSAENYVPILLGFYSETPGKLQTQAEAQKDPLTQFLTPKPEALGTFQEWNDMRDTTLLEQVKNRFGLKNDVNSITNKMLSVDGHYAYKNIFSADEMPDLSSLESYRAARDSGQLEAMDRYAYMVQTNNGVFNRETRKIKDDTNLGFTSFTEYNQLTPQQLQIADQRIRSYNDYYVAKALEAKAKDNYESSAKTKGRQKALGSLAIGALTGGIFALGGAGSIASSISQSLGGVLQASTIAAAAGGAAAGGLQGGLKGALTGGLTAGLGAAAGSAIGDYLGGSEALAQGAEAVTQNPSIFNGGATSVFGSDLTNPWGGLLQGSAGRINDVANSITQGAVNVAGYGSAAIPSVIDIIGGATVNNSGILGDITSTANSTTSGVGSTLADNIGDQAGCQITSQLNDAAAGDQQPSQQQPAQTTPSDTQPTTNIPQLSRSGGLFGASKYVGTSAPAQAASLNSNYNSGIRLNTSAAPPTSELGGLLTQLRN
jgi:hypothetical protein